eukprot:2923871-Prymnesium_polylepis.1
MDIPYFDKSKFQLNMERATGEFEENVKKMVVGRKYVLVELASPSHTSLQRSVESQHHTTGGFKLEAEAVKQLVLEIAGCDLCVAYSIKHRQPKEKVQSPEADDSSTELEMYYDSFGKVSVTSAQYGYHHAHLFWIPSKVVGWLLGSVSLDEQTVASLIKRVLATLTVWLSGYTITVKSSYLLTSCMAMAYGSVGAWRMFGADLDVCASTAGRTLYEPRIRDQPRNAFDEPRNALATYKRTVAKTGQRPVARCRVHRSVHTCVWCSALLPVAVGALGWRCRVIRKFLRLKHCDDDEPRNSIFLLTSLNCPGVRVASRAALQVDGTSRAL